MKRRDFLKALGLPVAVSASVTGATIVRKPEPDHGLPRGDTAHEQYLDVSREDGGVSVLTIQPDNDTLVIEYDGQLHPVARSRIAKQLKTFLGIRVMILEDRLKLKAILRNP